MTSDTSADTPAAPPPQQRERADLLETLRRHRGFLLHTVRGLTDEQAALTPTVSALSLGGLVKHVALTEQTWASFITDGPMVFGGDVDPSDWAGEDSSQDPDAEPEGGNAWDDGHRMLPGETLESLLASYAAVADATDALVQAVDLDAERALPQAPWFEPDASWSARRVFLHIIAETSQHAGHADILRETIDGQKTMG